MQTPTQPYVASHPLTETYKRGMQALGEGRVAAAIDILAAEPPESPCRELARGNLGLCLLRMERFREAEGVLRDVLTVLESKRCPHAPSHLQFARNLAEALLEQGRRAEAATLFETFDLLVQRLLGEAPEYRAELELGHAHALNSWGSTLIHLRQYQEAVDVLKAARNIYEKGWDRSPVGRAETLTNYGLALRLANRRTEAELAYVEALSIAEADGNSDQVVRVLMGLLQLGSNHVSSEESITKILRAADEAAGQGRHAAAYVRLCTCAEAAAEGGDLETGLRLVRRAKEIEGSLDFSNVNRPKLRTTIARLLRGTGAPIDKILAACIEGARFWFDLIAQNRSERDVTATAGWMHEHFRILSRELLDAGRPEDALMSFEAGRAIAHALARDTAFVMKVVAKNPFAPADGAISKEALRQAQSELAEGEVIVSIAVLPPDIVAFVVGHDSVDARTIAMPPSTEERADLFNSIDAIPARLEDLAGESGIPALVREVGEVIRDSVGSRVVRSIFPYSTLHQVPWRAVLRQVGLPWTQLRCSVDFGLLLHDHSTNSELPRRCIALGHGKAGGALESVDLGDEAREFAAEFGGAGRCIVPCRSADVRAALQGQSVVLLSCHGAADARWNDDDLVLYLADGGHPSRDLFPHVVSAPLVILSACDSGVYRMDSGDSPIGAASQLLRLGARSCVGARYRVDARFSASFFRALAAKLASGASIVDAFAEVAELLEKDGYDLWRHLACLEVLGGS